jgi:hypothetical protein
MAEATPAPGTLVAFQMATYMIVGILTGDWDEGPVLSHAMILDADGGFGPRGRKVFPYYGVGEDTPSADPESGNASMAFWCWKETVLENAQRAAWAAQDAAEKAAHNLRVVEAAAQGA